MKTIFTLLLAILSIPAFAQTDPSPGDSSEEILTVVEIHPEFPGGYENMMKFLAKNIKYPKKAKRKGVEGRVIVQFVVNKEGKIEDIKIIKDIGEGCGEEAARVVRKMPDWTPEYQKGKPVKVRFNLPVKFELTED